jgi:hypothetical protein
MEFTGTKPARLLFYGACTLIMLVQLWFCLFQIGSYWQWGHNGYNSAAYQVAARNSLRHGIIWPVQYHTSETRPEPAEYYTHAPLALHWLTTLSMALFGDHEVSVRLVPALFSLLMTLMLLILLARHYSKPVALIAGAVFVLLPINTVYCNMSNHSTGCIFFALVMFDGYLRWSESGRRAHLIQAAVGGLGAMLFDWPGYTLALCLATAAFYEGLKPRPGEGFRWTPQLRFALTATIIVGLTFRLFWTWISSVQGIDNVVATISNRSETTDIVRLIRDLYGTVIAVTFPSVIRCLAIAWLAVMFLRHASRRFARRDVVPLSFLAAGIIQFVLFPNAAALHYYWNWQLTPFVAIAAAQILTWLTDEGGGRIALAVRPGLGRTAVRIAAWVLPLALLAHLYVPEALRTFREGRAVAGSFGIPGYQREYRKILFAKFVNQATDWGDGVAIHTSIAHRIEFDACLDRQWSDVNDEQLENLGEHLDPARPWVLIGDMDKIKRKLLVGLVRKHPITQVDSYFLIDLRSSEPGADVYWYKPMRPLLGWRIFVSPFDPPVTLARNTVLEERLRKLIGKKHLSPGGPKGQGQTLNVPPPAITKIKPFPGMDNKPAQ